MEGLSWSMGKKLPKRVGQVQWKNLRRLDEALHKTCKKSQLGQLFSQKYQWHTSCNFPIAALILNLQGAFL
jgi:hypothetical protein